MKDLELPTETRTESLRLWDFSAAVGLALVSSETVELMLQRCTDLAVSYLDAAFARIWTVDSTGEVLELRASAGLYTHVDGPHARVPVGAFKIGLIAAARRPHLTNDVLTDPRLSNREWAVREGMVSFAGYPLLAGEKLIGVLAMFARHALSDNLLDVLGSVAGAIAMGIERRATEDVLRSKEQQLRIIAESASDGIVTIDSRAVITFCNRALADLFGYAPQELLGQSLTVLMPEQLRAKHLASFTRYVSSREPSMNWQRLELPAHHRSGREFPVEVSFGEAIVDGQPMFTGVLRNISERKLLDTVVKILNENIPVEKALEATLQAICRGLGYDAGLAWKVDEHERVLRCQATWSDNEEATPFTEVSCTLALRYGEGLPGSIWARNDFIYRRDVTKSLNFLRAEQAKRAGIRSGFGFPVIARESTVAIVEFYTTEAYTLREETSRLLTGICDRVGHFIDRARSREEIEQQTLALRRSNSDLRQFAAIAAHEIAEPLRTVTQHLKKLEREELAAESAQRVGASLETIAFMNRTLADLIAYSELEEPRPEEYRIVSLKTVLQWVRINLHALIGRELAVITEDPLPDVVGDESQLTRLLQKLVENAIRFHGPQTPRVNVAASRTENEWVFCVKDNGKGIEPEQLPHIFEFEHRGGIGLAICRRIVERHGGRIWAKSEPGSGSEFCFSLPGRPG